MSRPEAVTLVEVGPRDGLQNEPHPIPAATKIALVERLAEAGLGVVETTSFVSARWVPQMGDATEVLTGIRRRPGVRYPVLTPNLKGLERAIEAGADEVAIFAAASETFSRRNTNASIDESFERFAPMLERAQGAGVAVRGYVSCALGCPYEGAVPTQRVAEVAERLLQLGCFEISLGDTIGCGTPVEARRMVTAVAERVPPEQLALHFHDTRGQALANLFACLDTGVTTIDTAVGGLGGCPYAPGAAGNVATEDVLYMLDGMGIETGVDRAAIVATAHWIAGELGQWPRSRVATVENTTSA